jgi:hypothetical protein
LPLGRYKLRIAALGGGRASTTVLAQQQQVLTVFGTVSFATLFKKSAAT